MVRLKYGQLRTIVCYQQNHRREYEEQLNVYDLRMLLHTMTFDVRYLSDEASGWKSTVGTSGMLQRSQNKGEERLIPDHHLFEMGAFGMLSHEWGPPPATDTCSSLVVGAEMGSDSQWAAAEQCLDFSAG